MSNLALDKVSVQLLSDPQKDGYLTKLGGKGLSSNWKRRWFVLKDDVLYYFKVPNAKKASGQVELRGYTSVSEGGKNRKYCFKVEGEDSNKQNKVFYMSAETEEEMKGWLNELSAALKKAHNPMASIVQTPPRSSIKAWAPKKISSIFINAAEARNLKSTDLISGKGDPYLIVDVGNCQVRTKTVYKNLSPFWGEDFYLDMVETNAKESVDKIKVTVWDEDKFTKDTLIGEVILPVASLSDGKLHEQWYPLFPADAHVYVSGDMHMRIDHNSIAKTLSVRVIEGRHLASKDANGLSDPYVKLGFNKQKKKTKVIKKTLNPFFNEEFIFEVPDSYYKASPEEKEGFTLQVECWDWDMVGHNDYMGEVTIHLAEFEPNVIYDMWYILLNKTAASSDPSTPTSGTPPTPSLLASMSSTNETLGRPTLGEVRLKLKFSEDEILSLMAYEPLLQLIQSSRGPEVALLLESVISSSERGEFASVVVHAAEAYRTALPLLIYTTTKEINATQEETIFRGNSLATKALDSYMKLIAAQYLHNTIGATIKKIFAFKYSCEVDESRDKEENIPKNMERLQKFVQQILEDIYTSVNRCPRNLKELFSCMRKASEARFGVDNPTKYSVISSFLFLRHFCPAILNPKLFGVMPDHPDSQTARNLTLISKVVQTVANLAEFGPKESYLIKMNDLVLSSIPGMRKFLDQVSEPPTEPDPHPRSLSSEKSLTSLTTSPLTASSSSSLLPTSQDMELELLKSAAALRRFAVRALPDLKTLNADPNLPAEKKENLQVLLNVI